MVTARSRLPGEAEPSSEPMTGPFEVAGIASSAGGLMALERLLSLLPADFPAAVAVVQHLDPRHRSLLAPILARHTALVVREACEGDRLCSGTVFTAPPNRHLLINPDGTLSLSRAGMVRFLRPSADLLFESLAQTYRKRAIAVVLTGAGKDGAAGVVAVKRMGGIVIAQDRGTSEFFGMPGAAIESGCADYVLPLDEIPARLVVLVKTGVAK